VNTPCPPGPYVVPWLWRSTLPPPALQSLPVLSTYPRSGISITDVDIKARGSRYEGDGGETKTGKELTYISTRRTRAPTHHDLILLSARRLTRIIPTADPRAPRQVIIPAVVEHIRPLDGMIAARIIRNLVAAAPRRLRRRRVERRLIDISPEATRSSGGTTRRRAAGWRRWRCAASRPSSRRPRPPYPSSCPAQSSRSSRARPPSSGCRTSRRCSTDGTGRRRDARRAPMCGCSGRRT